MPADGEDFPESKRTKMASALDQLKSYTTVVADTGDINGILDWN